MKLYVQANENFAMRADGEFLGNFKTTAAIDSVVPAYFEILPHFFGEPFCFYLNYRPKSHKNAVFYTLPQGDVLLSVTFLPQKNNGFKLLYQTYLEPLDALITVYRDGAVKLVAENSHDAETVNIPFGAEDFAAEVFNGDIAVYSRSGQKFACIFRAEDLSLKFFKIVDDLEFTPVFRTKTRLGGIERTTAFCEWSPDKNGFSASVNNIERENPWEPSSDEKFAKRAFFERIQNKLPVDEMLSPDLLPNKDLLADFLGSFDRVLPDFCTEKGVLLSYKGEQTRLVKCFDLDFENGRICNLREI